MDWSLAFADVVFLCDRIADGREVSRLLNERGIKIAGTYASDTRERTRQKRHFFKGDARVKGTTIHSFKGWEGDRLSSAFVLPTATGPRALFTQG